MATTKADKRILRPLQHGPETSAQDAVGAAHDLGQHFFAVLLTPHRRNRRPNQGSAVVDLQGLAAELSSTALRLL